MKSPLRTLRLLSSLFLQDAPPTYDRTGYDIGRRVRWLDREGKTMRGVVYGTDKLTMPASEFGEEQSMICLLIRDDEGREWSVGPGVELQDDE